MCNVNAGTSQFVSLWMGQPWPRRSLAGLSSCGINLRGSAQRNTASVVLDRWKRVSATICNVVMLGELPVWIRREAPVSSGCSRTVLGVSGGGIVQVVRHCGMAENGAETHMHIQICRFTNVDATHRMAAAALAIRRSHFQDPSSRADSARISVLANDANPWL